MTDIPVFGVVLLCIALFGIGAFLGYYITKKLLQKHIRENPPIDEKMIRIMYQQMGRKPSEAQIRQIMNRMKTDPKK